MSINADVEIEINARDNASSVVDRSTKSINKSWKEMHDQQRAVRREFELNNRGLVTGSRAVQAFGSQINRMIGLYQTWTLINIRTQDANRNASDAVQNYMEILDQFGSNSPEAERALKRMNEALEEQKKAAMDARLGIFLLVGSFAASATRLVTDVLPKLKSFISVFSGKGAGTAAQSTLDKFIGPAASRALPKIGLQIPKIVSRIGTGAAGFGIGTALSLASDIQPAFGGANDRELPGGFEAIGPLANKIQSDAGNAAQVVINVVASTAQEITDKVNEAIKQSHLFG